MSEQNWQATPSGGTGPLCPPGGSNTQNMEQTGAASGHQVEQVRQEFLPLMSFSTQVKVTPPSLLLSLNRSRKVPGGFVLRMARSRSLLMKPMMYLQPTQPVTGLLGAGDLVTQCSLTADFNLTLHSKGPRYTFSQGQ